ncbi:MAG: phosphoribosylformylglycinamidine synthase subunit PurQ, partial [Nitrospinota bacterium]|nr:phosphoribosylformylglycinamidine synthase subunit PurQ [Nitrospinota bacterium]
LRMPIAHGEGNYFCDPDTLAALEDNDQIVFKYCDSEGSLESTANPNGSLGHIAGVCNQGSNVVGLMPHPERASEAALGGDDGLRVFSSVLAGAVS